MKKTKIICTLGPSSDSYEVIKELASNGMNVARFNFSHGSYEEHLAKLNVVRKVNEEGFNIALLLDTKGPEIRVGMMENDAVTIEKGSTVKIFMHDIGLNNATNISITYPGLIDDVNVGNEIRIDDGKIILSVKSLNKIEGYIECEAINTAILKNKKSVGVPLVDVKMPFISSKDEMDLKFACDNHFDYIAASFVRTKQDILDMKAILAKYGGENIKIIAKIENHVGYNNAKEILEVADGLMVARGDLGVEVRFENVPVMQKRLIEAARKSRKIIVVATQMLESMISSPVPTRAEVTDVANAVFEAVDGIMLSGETANGKYPIEAVTTQAKISEKVEEAVEYKHLTTLAYNEIEPDTSDCIAYNVANTALTIDAKYIFCFTRSGNTSRRISHFRPKCPIISITNNKEALSKLNLYYGVYGYFIEHYEINVDEYEKIAVEVAKKLGANCNDKIIITGGDKDADTSLMKIVTIK